MSATKILARIIGYCSLLVMILMAVLYLTDTVTLERVKLIMLITTVIWFVCAGFWTWQEEAGEVKS